MLAWHASTGVLAAGVGGAVVVARGGEAVVLADASDSSAVAAVTLSDDGRYLISAQVSKAVRCWDVSTSTQVSNRSVARRPTALAVAKFQGEVAVLVACSGELFAMRVPDLAFGETKEAESLKFCLGHTSSIITSVAVNASTDRVATTDRNEKVRVSHYPRTEVIQSFCLGHSDFVARSAFINSTRLASCGGDGTLRIWDSEKGLELASLSLAPLDEAGKAKPLSCLAVSPGSQTFVAVSVQGVVIVALVDAATGMEVARGSCDAGAAIVDLVFLSESRLLAFVGDALKIFVEFDVSVQGAAVTMQLAAASPAASALAAASCKAGLVPAAPSLGAAAGEGENKDGRAPPSVLRKHALEIRYDTARLEPEKARPRGLAPSADAAPNADA
ncbi:WD40-repeat-containing domain protein [Pelagophyceae sp. CCMP2097]|nr:WD40-repeat-containing domain protein [Pelagophyceae sp. CCMP2097]